MDAILDGGHSQITRLVFPQISVLWKARFGTNVGTGDTIIKGLVLLSTAVIVMSFAAFAADKDSILSAKSLEASASWVVEETTHLNSLTIAKDARNRELLYAGH